MANGKISQAFFVFPLLHKRVLKAVSKQVGPVVFHKEGQEADARKEYDTFVMGRFACDNDSCKKAVWTSKKVGILIRQFANTGQGMGYNATVFNQRCKSCNTLGTFTLHERSYVERVAYRLRHWAGVPQERPPFETDETGPPHEADLCEGCKNDRCQKGRRARGDYGL
ncbi:hypothetical protein PG994_008663 [Apiospora phragmitis]|uniref:3CxxC-type domain-containing protein n=1 Tax=Apiospora phragmitis TaxID=2905665 RepID=A0ABR1UH36_9PEZI